MTTIEGKIDMWKEKYTTTNDVEKRQMKSALDADTYFAQRRQEFLDETEKEDRAQRRL